MIKKKITEPVCEDCKKPLNPQRAEIFVVCTVCFEKRIDKWLAEPQNKVV